MTEVPILASHFPFEQPPNWLEWLDEHAQPWCFRACWMVKDLKQVYALLNDQSHLTNYRWKIPEEVLVHRIQHRLRTPGEQAVVFERKGKLVAYWEIFPVSRTNVLLYCPIRVEGWVLYYLLPADFPEMYALQAILLRILTFIEASYHCTYTVLVEIPSDHSRIRNLLETIRFENIANYSNQLGWVTLYRWST